MNENFASVSFLVYQLVLQTVFFSGSDCVTKWLCPPRNHFGDFFGLVEHDAIILAVTFSCKFWR